MKPPDKAKSPIFAVDASAPLSGRCTWVLVDENEEIHASGICTIKEGRRQVNSALAEAIAVHGAIGSLPDGATLLTDNRSNVQNNARATARRKQDLTELIRQIRKRTKARRIKLEWASRKHPTVKAAHRAARHLASVTGRIYRLKKARRMAEAAKRGERHETTRSSSETDPGSRQARAPDEAGLSLTTQGAGTTASTSSS